TEHGPGDDLWELAEALTDLSEGFTRWRTLHLTMVRRAMGAKTGTGGSSGASWLARTLRRARCPEPWSPRTPGENRRGVTPATPVVTSSVSLYIACGTVERRWTLSPG